MALVYNLWPPKSKLYCDQDVKLVTDREREGGESLMDRWAKSFSTTTKKKRGSWRRTRGFSRSAASSSSSLSSCVDDLRVVSGLIEQPVGGEGEKKFLVTPFLE